MPIVSAVPDLPSFAPSRLRRAPSRRAPSLDRPPPSTARRSSHGSFLVLDRAEREMAPVGHTSAHRPQPVHRLPSTNACPREPERGPAASTSKPTPGQPISVTHFLHPMHFPASTNTGAPGRVSCTHGERKMIAEGPSNSIAVRWRRWFSSREFRSSRTMHVTPSARSAPSMSMGARRSPIRVTPVPGCGCEPVMAVVALSSTQTVTSCPLYTALAMPVNPLAKTSSRRRRRRAFAWAAPPRGLAPS